MVGSGTCSRRGSQRSDEIAASLTDNGGFEWVAAERIWDYASKVFERMCLGPWVYLKKEKKKDTVPVFMYLEKLPKPVLILVAHLLLILKKRLK